VLSRQNLVSENTKGEIYVTGNTVIDAFLSVLEEDYRFGQASLDALDFANRRVMLLTCHRRENLGGNMNSIFRAINDAVNRHTDTEVVFPVHLNPLVRDIAGEVFAGNPRVHMIEPLEYRTFANLIKRCHLVLTDSGGLQEEAPAVGKPVLVLRNTTERPEAVDAGTVLLAGTSYEEISAHLERLLGNRDFYNRMANAVNPYGDGKACGRIVLCMKKFFNAYDGPIEQFI
jgi:UDP-N-acetylglucosamine 2-epimerase (non-hydrolysing)